MRLELLKTSAYNGESAILSHYPALNLCMLWLLELSVTNKFRTASEVKQMGMGWRVAVATTDGKVINEHFGRARAFYIFDIKLDGTHEFLEKRTVTPLCRDWNHDDNALLDITERLKDCSAVLVSKIGPSAMRILEINGIAVFEEANYIDETLGKMARYFVKTNYISRRNENYG